MSADAIDRLIGECRFHLAIEPARVDAACSQLASYRRHMAELEAERAKLQKSLAAALDGERFLARSHVELAKVLGVDPAMLEDGPACLHDAIAALKDKVARTEQESAAACGRMRQQKRDDLRARLARSVELLRIVDRAALVQAHPDVCDFLAEEYAREQGR